jgi:antibiotic biosynthesis monooxygenase (ABM) superfamily enzyme
MLCPTHPPAVVDAVRPHIAKTSPLLRIDLIILRLMQTLLVVRLMRYWDIPVVRQSRADPPWRYLYQLRFEKP